MIGDVAAAVGTMELDARAFEKFGRREHVLIVAVASHGDHVGMFNDEKLIADFAALALVDERTLQLERCGVIQAAEIAHDTGVHSDS
jgi:hypothetical protein